MAKKDTHKMREKHQKQMPLMESASDHPQAKEMEVISNIIDNTPTICGYVLQDLIGVPLSNAVQVHAA